MRLTILLLALILAGCFGSGSGLPDPPVDASTPGCAKDTDCKGSRICVEGRCTEAGVDMAIHPDMSPIFDLVPGDFGYVLPIRDCDGVHWCAPNPDPSISCGCPGQRCCAGEHQEPCAGKFAGGYPLCIDGYCRCN